GGEGRQASRGERGAGRERGLEGWSERERARLALEERAGDARPARLLLAPETPARRREERRREDESGESAREEEGSRRRHGVSVRGGAGGAPSARAAGSPPGPRSPTAGS